MKKAAIITIIYTLYASILPAVFLSNNEKKVGGYISKLGKFLAQYLPEGWVNDKTFHGLFFFCFPIFIFTATHFLTRIKFSLNLLLIILFNVSAIVIIEEIQPFFGRSYEANDMVYGFLGLFSSLSLIMFSLLCLPRKREIY